MFAGNMKFQDMCHLLINKLASKVYDLEADSQQALNPLVCYPKMQDIHRRPSSAFKNVSEIFPQ